MNMLEKQSLAEESEIQDLDAYMSEPVIKKEDVIIDQLLKACKAVQSAYARTDNGQPLAMAHAVKKVIDAIRETEGTK